MPNNLTLRVATKQDIPALAQHRRWMMEDIRRMEAKELDPAVTARMEEIFREYAAERLGKKLFAWLVEDETGNPVASASISLLDGWPPLPNNLKGIHPYLHSVYTMPEFRRQGLARRLVEAAIDFVRGQDLPFVKLNASKEGRSIYELLGFVETNEMRLRLK